MLSMILLVAVMAAYPSFGARIPDNNDMAKKKEAPLPPRKGQDTRSAFFSLTHKEQVAGDIIHQVTTVSQLGCHGECMRLDCEVMSTKVKDQGVECLISSARLNNLVTSANHEYNTYTRQTPSGVVVPTCPKVILGPYQEAAVFVPLGGRCYYLAVNVWTSWAYAKSQCISLGAELVALETEAEKEALKELYNTVPEFNTEDPFWMNLEWVDGNYKWGTPSGGFLDQAEYTQDQYGRDHNMVLNVEWHLSTMQGAEVGAKKFIHYICETSP